MMRAHSLCLLLAGLGACGETASVDYGQKNLASLDEPCQQVAGLTGNAILAMRTDRIETTLGHRNVVDGSVQSTSPVSLELTWPANPVATCYPPYQRQGVNPAGPRVAIEQLQLHFRTTDGKFDETLSAKAWLTTSNGVPVGSILLAVTTPDEIEGSFRPDPKILDPKSVVFTTQLLGEASKNGAGNVGVSRQEPEELGAAIFLGGIAVATWPTMAQ